MSFWRKIEQTAILSGDSTNSRYKDNTTQIIALVLLITFVITVFGLFFVNIYSYKFLDVKNDLDFKKGWFDLLKNSLVLLSTALTTVIGYYFGQREGTLKSEKADQDSKNKDQEVAQIAKDMFENRNNKEKDGAFASNDLPTDIDSSSEIDGDIIIP